VRSEQLVGDIELGSFMAKNPKPAFRLDTLPNKKTIDAGIYIDFEGFAPNAWGKNDPSLIGIYRPADDCFRQIVFSNGLQIASEDTDVGYPVIFNSDMKSVLKQLVSEARKNQPLFAFSEHEYDIIDDQIDIKRSIVKRYRNVNLIAKKFFKENQPDKPLPSSLLEVIVRLNLDTTDKVKDRSITDRIREVKKNCKSHKKWASAPKEKKKLWHEVLEHNKWDCEIMYKALRKFLCHVQ
jgi:hypothetical protein